MTHEKHNYQTKFAKWYQQSNTSAAGVALTSSSATDGCLREKLWSVNCEENEMEEKKIENTETQFDSKNKKVVEIKSLKITPARNKWQGIKFRFGFGFERRK